MFFNPDLWPEGCFYRRWRSADPRRAQLQTAGSEEASKKRVTARGDNEHCHVQQFRPIIFPNISSSFPEITIGFQNIRSCRYKGNYISELMSEHHLTIFCLAETWLFESDVPAFCSHLPSKFGFLHRARSSDVKTSGGGVGCVFNHSLSLTIVSHFQLNFLHLNTSLCHCLCRLCLNLALLSSIAMIIPLHPLIFAQNSTHS